MVVIKGQELLITGMSQITSAIVVSLQGNVSDTFCWKSAFASATVSVFG